MFRDGTPLWLPPRYFGMLATACRLKELGATMEWSDDEMSVRFRDFRFFAPPDTKLAPLSLQSFLIEDVWRTGRTDLEGKSLLDVGAHVGFFSVVCAKRGATVHAFEPFPLFQEFIRRNAMVNGVADRIIIHGVGLSDRDRSVDSTEFLDCMASPTHGSWKRGEEVPQVSLVDSVGYLKRHKIGPVDFLKLNCEGCEYPLLQDSRFLEWLRPMFISLEYHDGGMLLHEILDRAGYEVQWGSDDPVQRARQEGQDVRRTKGREELITIRPAGSE